MDEDEWLESDEGQRWAADSARAAMRAAESLKRLAAATEALRIEVADTAHRIAAERRGNEPASVSQEMVRRLLERASTV